MNSSEPPRGDLPDVREIINLLSLKPLPEEGGLFRETYRCEELIPQNSLSQRYCRDKSFSTAIYYLLTPDAFSAMHRVASDEIFHFYLGDPVTMLQLHRDGGSEVHVLGPDIRAGHQPQCVVKRGTWQGTLLNPGGRYALMGCTVAPAFDPEDFELGNRAKLVRQYPDQAALIEKLSAP